MKYDSAALVVIFLSMMGCFSHKIQYGVSKNGNYSYPLCEKSKSRIADMSRVSFYLPELFKGAPCVNWSDYGYSPSLDVLSIEIPGVIVNTEQMDIGGLYSMYFYGGTRGRQSFYLKPDIFFVDQQEEAELDRSGFKLVTSSWIDHEDLHCARFYKERENEIKLTREVEYFCWESKSGFDSPFLISASQSIPTGSHAVTNLDKELIEPVLASLQVNRASAAQLAQFASERSAYCASVKASYDSGKWAGYGLSDFPDRRRAIRALRNCGYSMPEPVGIDSYEQLFRPNGQLIGDGDDYVRRVSPSQFDELERQLLSLQPRRLADRPKSRAQGFDSKAGGLITVFVFNGGYSGDWYVMPPNYSRDDGFGIRRDPIEGRVIDVDLMQYKPGFKIIRAEQ